MKQPEVGAVLVGVNTDGTTVAFVRLTASYNVHGAFLGYHYRPYYPSGKSGMVKCIASMPLKEMAEFVMEYCGKDLTWSVFTPNGEVRLTEAAHTFVVDCDGNKGFDQRHTWFKEA